MLVAQREGQAVVTPERMAVSDGLPVAAVQQRGDLLGEKA